MKNPPLAPLDRRLARLQGERACASCPLRSLPGFEAGKPEELDVIQGLKLGELQLSAGEALIQEGAMDSALFTLLDGWACRYRSLQDGRRQILSFLLPGDFIGLQQRMTDAAVHGVVALTTLRACRFKRDAVWALHRELPSLGYDVTWLAAREGVDGDEHVLSLGRRSATERLAALLVELHERLKGLPRHVEQEGMEFPLSQRQLADWMGLSLAHAHRSWRQLVRQGWVQVLSPQRIALPRLPELAALAHLPWPLPSAPRPLI